MEPLLVRKSANFGVLYGVSLGLDLVSDSDFDLGLQRQREWDKDGEGIVSVEGNFSWGFWNSRSGLK
jgi:hypothetical protein